MANNKQVLIVEDDTFLQGLMAGKVGKAGYDVTTTSNGEEAMTRMLDNKFDVVLLDLLLPDISGFMILENIRKNSKGMPVIVFSNLSDEKDISKAMKLGATEYMIKSNFTLEELVEKMKKVA